VTDESVITHHADRIISLVIPQIPRNSAEMLKFRGKGQIPRLEIPRPAENFGPYL